MKALILSGGKGTRLRPITFSLAKQLVPIANKPVIEYGLEAIIEAGIKDIGIIVGDTAEEVKNALGDGSRWKVKITYIVQDAPLGLAHAVKTARKFLDEDDFIMYLGDNLIKSSLIPLVQEFNQLNPSSLILVTSVPNAMDFGVAEIINHKIVNLEEKPKNPKSNLALIGVYIFSKQIHQAIDQLQPSWRGEYEITEAIQILINQNKQVIAHQIAGWWKDTGTVDSMLDANRMILGDVKLNLLGDIDSNSKIEGNVQIEKGAKIIQSTILGPAIIGTDCHIEKSYIGPFTSIAQKTMLFETEVQNSIVMPECNLETVGSRIESSLIGRGVKITSCKIAPKSLNLVIGDHGAVTLP